jgi:hypothetical protein
MQIYIAHVHNANGDDVLYAGGSDDKALQALYAYVKYWWNQLTDVDIPDEEELPDMMSADALEMQKFIDIYFERHPDMESGNISIAELEDVE